MVEREEEREKKGPFADVILCQRVFIPDEFSHVSLVEHYDGHGIHSPAILRGLCCHTKTLRRGIVMKKKNCTKSTLFWYTEQQRCCGYFVPKNTTCRCTNNKMPHFRVSEINTGSELMSSLGPYSVLVGGTHQGHIRHGVDHHSLVLHCVLSDSPEAWFQHVVPVEEGLLCSRFHPHLKLSNHKQNKKNLF